jgi:hypothetical protein
MPSSLARDTAAAIPRALKVPVGFKPSSLMNSRSKRLLIWFAKACNHPSNQKRQKHWDERESCQDQNSLSERLDIGCIIGPHKDRESAMLRIDCVPQCGKQETEDA